MKPKSLIIGLIFVAIVAGTIYVGTRNHSNPPPETVDVPTTTNGAETTWKTYENADFGISFKYPDELGVRLVNASSDSYIDVFKHFDGLPAIDAPDPIDPASLKEMAKNGFDEDQFQIHNYDLNINSEINNSFDRYLQESLSRGIQDSTIPANFESLDILEKSRQIAEIARKVDPFCFRYTSQYDCGEVVDDSVKLWESSSVKGYAFESRYCASCTGSHFFIYFVLPRYPQTEVVEIFLPEVRTKDYFGFTPNLADVFRSISVLNRPNPNLHSNN